MVPEVSKRWCLGHNLMKEMVATAERVKRSRYKELSPRKHEYKSGFSFTH